MSGALWPLRRGQGRDTVSLLGHDGGVLGVAPTTDGGGGPNGLVGRRRAPSTARDFGGPWCTREVPGALWSLRGGQWTNTIRVRGRDWGV